MSTALPRTHDLQKCATGHPSFVDGCKDCDGDFKALNKQLHDQHAKVQTIIERFAREGHQPPTEVFQAARTEALVRFLLGGNQRMLMQFERLCGDMVLEQVTELQRRVLGNESQSGLHVPRPSLTVVRGQHAPKR